ncbi:TniQ family protein [Hymenobacter metallilatus]|uniref:TniQ domain-containing protein n=1 Tax=Hymenobacter metallilatus TaxID=2493666 RepID=A0A3R9N386_9BACT|nr:TniQ family protein [Hymenobacter metallilatus]RSK23846.1 hypothetical protein EI290_22030 [Hymenobacter metallilatus]
MSFDSGDRWPAFVLPKEDELLSSWLLRNIHAHHMKAHSFCKIVWPSLAFWNRDLDRMAHPQVWQLMARKVGISAARSYQTTLASYEGLLFKRAFFKGAASWILPLGIYHRTYTHYGMQFCPSCLRRDGITPYYRRWWRLALAVGCPKCGCWLLDACPFCERPVMFHRGEIGRKNELAAYPLSCCTSCYTDLADLQSEQLPAQLLSHQQQWYQRLAVSTEGQGQYEYFDVLHQVLMLLSSKRPSLQRFQRAVAENAGVAFYQPSGGFENRIEALRVDDRRRIVGQAVWLLDEWPFRLQEVIRSTNTRLSAILSERHHLPAAFVAEMLSVQTG